jgi:glycosyltransferase involved in cell wall biosynthesis
MLVDALADVRSATLLVATESDVTALGHQLDQRSVRWRSTPLRTEDDRARAHAAADVVVVPRFSPGGLPIKLLDALARGVPVVAMERALAGFELYPACLVTNDTAYALGRGLADALSMPSEERAAQIARGHAYLAAHHGSRHFALALDRVVASALAQRPNR